MTRRGVLRAIAGSYALAQVSCGSSDDWVCREVDQLQERCGLAFIGIDPSTAFKRGFKMVGRLRLAERAEAVWLSPDAKTVVWSLRHRWGAPDVDQPPF